MLHAYVTPLPLNLNVNLFSFSVLEKRYDISLEKLNNIAED